MRLIKIINMCKLNLIFFGKRLEVKRVIIGALIGAIPGVLMVLLTFLVPGEAALTLGVNGTFVAIIGLLIGAMIGARKRRKG